MRTSATLLVLVTFGSLATLACAGRGEDESDLDAATLALVAANEELQSTEQDLEGGLELPLSGAPSESDPVDTSSEEAAATAAWSNAGIYFQPAGCISNTRDGAVVTHVFDDCTGPHGRVHLTGTVTSTWSRTETGVSVVHETEGFQINGATVDHSVTISYGYEAGVYTRHRGGVTTGVTGGGRAIAHSADYTTTWDPDMTCVTRDGSSETSIGEREFSRTIDGYERCGVGEFGCPNAGTLTLTGPRLTVELTFRGSGSYDATANDHTFSDRQLRWCDAN